MKDNKKRQFEPFVLTYAGKYKLTRLIDENEDYHERFSTEEAISRANRAGLDLIMLQYPSRDKLALCKIMNFGKWKYDQKKKHKKQENKQPKEIRFGVHISQNDIEHKIRHANEFLDQGHEVTLSVQIKGRDRSHTDLAREKMTQIAEMCTEHGHELKRRFDNRNLVIRFAPGKKDK